MHSCAYSCAYSFVNKIYSCFIARGLGRRVGHLRIGSTCLLNGIVTVTVWHFLIQDCVQAISGVSFVFSSEVTAQHTSNLLNGHYIRDLLALDACRPLTPVSLNLPSFISPLPVEALKGYSEFYPNKGFAHYLLDGISHGFRIGFDHSNHLKSSTRNMSLGSLHPPTHHLMQWLSTCSPSRE